MYLICSEERCHLTLLSKASQNLPHSRYLEDRRLLIQFVSLCTSIFVPFDTKHLFSYCLINDPCSLPDVLVCGIARLLSLDTTVSMKSVFRELIIEGSYRILSLFPVPCNLIEILWNFRKNVDEILLNFWFQSGAKECKSCRSRKMLKNAPTLAIRSVDTADNEPSKVS